MRGILRFAQDDTIGVMGAPRPGDNLTCSTNGGGGLADQRRRPCRPRDDTKAPGSVSGAMLPALLLAIPLTFERPIAPTQPGPVPPFSYTSPLATNGESYLAAWNTYT